MKNLLLIFVLLSTLCMLSCNSSDETSKQTTKVSDIKKKQTIAIIETSMGTIEAKLFPEKAPETVANFVGLAKGTQEWIEYKTKNRMHTPYYDGLIFHRVIPDFMIQTGDQKGNGTGGAGYKFEDEIVKGLTFDRPGLLAMANTGPNTNSSQFFITENPLPHLNGKHTIFGELIKGLDIVKAIARVPRDARDKPVEDVILKRIRIVKR